MSKRMKNVWIVASLSMVCSGCGHITVSKVGLLSFGDLEGRTIPPVVKGPVLRGTDRDTWLYPFYFLSAATEDAIKGTEYDTLVNCTVTTRTGLWAFSNSIEVEGTALNSKTLPKAGEIK